MIIGGLPELRPSRQHHLLAIGRPVRQHGLHAGWLRHRLWSLRSLCTLVMSERLCAVAPCETWQSHVPARPRREPERPRSPPPGDVASRAPPTPWPWATRQPPMPPVDSGGKGEGNRDSSARQGAAVVGIGTNSQSALGVGNWQAQRHQRNFHQLCTRAEGRFPRAAHMCGAQASRTLTTFFG
jgi:hypothetical protein